MANSPRAHEAASSGFSEFSSGGPHPYTADISLQSCQPGPSLCKYVHILLFRARHWHDIWRQKGMQHNMQTSSIKCQTCAAFCCMLHAMMLLQLTSNLPFFCSRTFLWTRCKLYRGVLCAAIGTLCSWCYCWQPGACGLLLCFGTVYRYIHSEQKNSHAACEAKRSWCTMVFVSGSTHSHKKSDIVL